VDSKCHKQFEQKQLTCPNLSEKDNEVSESFLVFCLLKRGSTSRTKEIGLSETTIGLNYKWRTTRKGWRPQHSMQDYYIDFRLPREARLSYSKNLQYLILVDTSE